MIQSNLKSIIGFILGAILIFLFMKNCSGTKDIIVDTPEKTVVVKLTTKLDTVWQKKYIHDTIRITKPSLVKVDTIFLDGTKIVQVMPKIRRMYSDSISPIDSVQVKYTANVTGTLDNISLDYKDWRAEKTIVRTNTIETTITNNIKPSGIYLGISGNGGLTELSPSITYLNNKNMFGVKYNIAGSQTPLQNIGIIYSRKIF